MSGAEAPRSRTWRLTGAAGELDITSYEAAGGRPRAELLLVHGAWSSNWYWKPYLMPWLASRGYTSHALSLRGHGSSEGAARWASVDGYVDDLARLASAFEEPVVVGHSMGGFIAQRYAELVPVRALALLASVPPSGPWAMLRRFTRHHPFAVVRALARFDLREAVTPVATARDLLFSRDASQTDKDHLLTHLQSESLRALVNMLTVPVRRRPVGRVPTLVVGAERDRIILPEDVHETGRLHGVTPNILPGISHMVTVDEGWIITARLLDAWLSQGVLGRTLVTTT